MTIDFFLEALRQNFPEIVVLTGEQAKVSIGSCTMGSKRNITGLARPVKTQQIQTILRLANTHKIAVHPFSSGHNWGYGSGMPVTDHCFMIDLSQMNRIISFDPVTGIVVLEPGVTQLQLNDFLIAQGHDFMVPTTGAGPTCSVVSNALERGFGISPTADHFAGVMSLTAILPDGRIYEGAHTGKGCEAIETHYKWGIGPYLDGLFSQSGYGVVTSMAIALIKRPKTPAVIYIKIDDERHLGNVIAELQHIAADYRGMIGGIKLMNATNTLAMAIPYPYKDVDQDSGILNDETLNRLCEQAGLSRWIAMVPIFAPDACLAPIRAHIRKYLRPYAKQFLYFDRKKIDRLLWLAKLLPISRKSKIGLSMIDLSLTLTSGTPNQTALKLAYWKSKRSVSERNGDFLNPARDGCGIIWYAPLAPFKSENIILLRETASAIMIEHRFDFLFSVTSLSHACVDCTIPILFDATDPNQCRRAQACFDALIDAGQKIGAYPYRMPISQMKKLTGGNESFWQLTDQIKRSLDPQNILAPGRYSRFTGRDY